MVVLLPVPSGVLRRADALTQRSKGNTVLPMKTLTFKVTEDEAFLIRSLAAKANLSVSEFLRRRAADLGAVQKKPGRVRCRRTGAIIFALLPQQPPLTTEDVRKMLADFP
jgi:hypothetical protein